MTAVFKGIAASSGIAIGKAFILSEPNFYVEKTTIEDPAKEMERFLQAIEQSKAELQAIRDKTVDEMGTENAAIFDAHILVLSDPELLASVDGKINSEYVNAPFALKETANMYITMLEQLDNDYMRERAADIRDVTKRVISHLLDVKVVDLQAINEAVIIVAEDLAPSDTAQLNRDFAKGFVTNIGGRTSHSAIMARSLEIPAVVGTKDGTARVKEGDLIIVDGEKGEVIINPEQAVFKQYEEMLQTELEEKSALLKLLHEATITNDGVHIELSANIGTPKDVDGVLANGAEGIGLYRTEFLYMERDALPTEEEQFEAYKEVLVRMKGKPVLVRTLDIGGDKHLPYLTLADELNPFLGLRAIRLCLEEQTIFKTQLRALLRASSYGNLKIMFPMIATLDEFRQAKALLLEEKETLVAEGVSVSNSIEVGIMVEIPSTAILADQFAKEADFFSIGTNDLIQYTLAADRMNEAVAHLYQPYNPAILRLVKMVIDAAHAEGKWAGMCGEMAGDYLAIPLLIGLGLNEFSMSAPSILKARKQIMSLTQSELKALAEEAIMQQSSEDVEALIKRYLMKS